MMRFVKLAVLLPLLAFVACDGSKDVTIQKILDALIVVSPEKPYLKDVLDISLITKTSFSKYSWKITPSMACNESDEAPTRHCRPEKAGEYLIQVDLSNGDAGGRISLEKKITVNVKNSGSTELTLSLSRQSSGGAWNEITRRSSNRNLDSGLPFFFQGETIRFDFSQSKNPGNLWIDLGSGYKKVESIFNEDFNWPPKDYTIRMKTTDEDGQLLAERVFVIAIQCPNPTLVADPTKISLTHSTTQDDLFTYHFAPGFVSGGRGGYEIKPDVNGDRVQDRDWLAIGDLSFYSVDATEQALNGLKTREAQFQIRDLECNAQTVVKAIFTYDIPHSDGILENNLPGQRPGYSYVEAILRGSASDNPRTNLYYNAAVNAATAAGANHPVVACHFNPTTKRGSIESYLKYPLTENVPPSLPSNYHGFSQFNFVLPAQQILTSMTHTTTAEIQYTTAFQGDGPPRRTFRHPTAPLKVRLEPTFTVTGACIPVPGNPSTGTEAGNVRFNIIATFTMPITGSDEDANEKISMTQGAAVCSDGDVYPASRPCTPPPPPPPVCGNGVREGTEQCDDGNSVDNDYCSNDCKSPVCGDGVREGGEQCDDGNNNNTDGCSNTCRTPVCGNGIQEGNEQCDDGNGVNNDHCSNSCMTTPCGNGIIDNGEQCDDGNNVNNDMCSNTCRAAACGDGVVQSGEQCDDGNQNNDDNCSNMCRAPVCGDGVRQGNEQCDDGNNNNTDGCSNTCRTPACGDGILQTGEQCDDGNSSNNDGCTNLCRNQVCGDGYVGPGEQCDDGNTNNNDLCSNMCKTAVCGDGMIQGNEQCDDGNNVNTDGCTNSCRLPACRDGIVQAGEQCDDGNTNNADGCTNSCNLPSCGDGIVQAGSGEECDNGVNNGTTGNSCDASCHWRVF